MHKNNDWGYHVKRRNVELMQREMQNVCPMFEMKIQEVAGTFSTWARPTYTWMFRSKNASGSSHFTFNVLRRVKASIFLQGILETLVCVICLSLQLLTPAWRYSRCPHCYVLKSWSFICCQICTRGYDAYPVLTFSLTIMWPIISRPEVAYFRSTDSLVDACV